MAPRHQQAVEVAIQQFRERVKYTNDLHPEVDEKKLFYSSYCIARLYRPDKHLVCHLCMMLNPSSPMYMKQTEVARHCRLQHPHATLQCDYSNCRVKFMFPEEKQDHQYYVHEKTYGWWIPNN
ncbi:hypothetical protein BS78_08G050900 [Paspalum vaginatum]|nr:hypothetical protein BS78_08G050900 [Paspalum vaginatum]